MLDAVIAAWYRLTFEDLRWILSDCDRPVGEISNASLPSKRAFGELTRIDCLSGV